MIELIQLPSNDQCQRIFHGRGHAYPGYEHINIEWLCPVCLIILYQPAEENWLNELADYLLEEVPACESVQVQHRYMPQAPIVTIKGAEISETTVEENGLKYDIQLGKNQNYGLFLDMVNGRTWVKQHSEGKTVLNLFAYTCAFSVAAIAGNANKVVNIDLSKSSLSKGRENHKLNGHDLSKVKFEGVNIFKSYSRLKKHGPYDLMICDPPSFQQGSVDIKRDYKKIISRIPQLMTPGATLMLCLNSPDLSDTFLRDEVAAYCPECEYIEEIKAPAIFKEAHVGKGLKVLIFRYLPSFN